MELNPLTLGVGKLADNLTCLEKTLEWVKSIIEIDSSSRFHRYKKIYKEYVNSIDPASGIISVESQKHLMDKYGVNDFYSSLNECEELNEIYLTFRHQGRVGKAINIPKDLLSEAVIGCISDVDEKGNKTKARNKLFELYCAAHLCASGYYPKLDEPVKKGRNPTDKADIVFQGHGYKAFVECKRISSKARIEDNIKKASDQLKKRYENYPSSAKNKVVGIILLSVSKLVIPPTHILYANSFHHVRQLCLNNSKAVLESIKSYTFPNNTLAIGTYYRIPFLLKSNIGNTPYINSSFRGINFDPLIMENNPNSKIFETMAKKICDGNPLQPTIEDSE